MKHPVEHLRFPEASVETVAKFRRVAGQMLGADAVVDTPDDAFDIGDQGLDPGQDLHRLSPRAGHQPLVTAGRVIQEATPLPIVGFYHHLGRQTLPRKGLNLLATDPGHQPHGGKLKFICRDFHGYQHLGPAGGATPTLPGLGAPK
jgi:hypothetical protein